MVVEDEPDADRSENETAFFKYLVLVPGSEGGGEGVKVRMRVGIRVRECVGVWGGGEGVCQGESEHVLKVCFCPQYCTANPTRT